MPVGRTAVATPRALFAFGRVWSCRCSATCDRPYRSLSTVRAAHRTAGRACVASTARCPASPEGPATMPLAQLQPLLDRVECSFSLASLTTACRPCADPRADHKPTASRPRADRVPTTSRPPRVDCLADPHADPGRAERIESWLQAGRRADRSDEFQVIGEPVGRPAGPELNGAPIGSWKTTAAWRAGVCVVSRRCSGRAGRAVWVGVGRARNARAEAHALWMAVSCEAHAASVRGMRRAQ